jgi:hypothetical protein
MTVSSSRIATIVRGLGYMVFGGLVVSASGHTVILGEYFWAGLLGLVVGIAAILFGARTVFRNRVRQPRRS